MMQIAMSGGASNATVGPANGFGENNIASESDWRSQREPVGVEETEILDRTYRWMATLPRELRPLITGNQYPHVVNRLGDLWPSCDWTRLYFQSLLIDRRRGRRGFPPAVKKELEALQYHYFVQHSGLPAMLWNAVPVRPPRIPRRVFPRHPEGNEIDIPPC